MRETHGAARVEAELAGRFLLQRRGGEGRRGVAPALLAIDGDDAQRAGVGSARPGGRLDGALDLARLRLGGETELLDLGAAVLEQLQRERLRAVDALALDGPVFLRLEGLDLFLALADHAQRRALHASGGQPLAHLLPQERREVEADEVIERAPRLLRVDQFQRQTARLTHRLADGVAGDLVEHHAVHVLAVEVAALLEDLLQVPGDGLAFAVRVGRQIERLGLAQAARDRLHVALVFFQHPVLHGVAVVGIDRAFLGNQIAHVAIGGQYVEIAPQVFFDGLRLGGRLDDDQVLCHDLKNARS